MDYILAQLTDINYRKTTGHEQLSSNQLKEAMQTFANLIREYPADLEAYLVLGDLYLAGEMFSAALLLYQKALILDPESVEISNRINLAKIEGNHDQPDLDPISDVALDRLYAILAKDDHRIDVQDVDQATKLLDQIIHSKNPAELVALHLDQIENLLPALLELNIRQAKVENRNELASNLEELQLAINSGDNWPIAGSKTKDHEQNKPVVHFEGKVTLLVPDRHHPSARASFIFDCLVATGCSCILIDESNGTDQLDDDVTIACNPHINPWLLEYMAAKTANKRPIILDLDKNFEEMPVYHPQYMSTGLGSPANARAYSAALLLSNIVTVPSQQFADSLNNMGYKATTIPDGWSRSNSLWDKTSNPRNTINIGWLGSTGLPEDVVEIRRIINRVIREFPRAQLVISESNNAFQLFSSLPDNRKLFIPEISYEDNPYLLGQLDILVVPTKNIPFNLTKSDTILMEAGVKRLPWVARNLPSFTEWNSGGLLANTLEEWHTNLRQLVMDGEMRSKLGDDGCRKAQLREMQLMKRFWIDVIDEALNKTAIRGLNSAYNSFKQG
jgi:tetratricopeptide (TPR) repeat protein